MQHILDKHDQDIRHAVIGQHALYKHDRDTKKKMFLENRPSVTTSCLEKEELVFKKKKKKT